MKKSPYKIMFDTLSANLEAHTIASCSEWAERYRVMGKPFPGSWSFTHHPWLREMHDCTSERMIGQKAAQMGFTECALNKTFYAIDIEKENVLYVLPAANPDATDFSTSRFDPALELSDHLSDIFSNVKNTGHKRAGTCNLFVRGSRSRSQLKSIPAGRMIFDEVDEMVQENIVLAFERMSGQHTKQAFLLSTPTREGYGINAFYQNSTQEHFMFKCPHCGQYIEFKFPDSLVVTADSINDPGLRNSYLQCPRPSCHGILKHEEKRYYLKDGIWVPTFKDNPQRGFGVNQLYSSTSAPWEIGELYIKAQTNPTDEQEFHNSKMGECHTVEGAQVTDAVIEECLAGYHKYTAAPMSPAIITMGIDVGKVLDYEIDLWQFDAGVPTIDINIACHCKVIAEGSVDDFEDLDELMWKFMVNFAVIDRDPETRSSLSFVRRFPGRAAMCKYSAGLSGRVMRYNEEEGSVQVDRTVWLDMALGRFHKGRSRITLPCDTSLDYKDHIKAPARIYLRDGDGNPIGKYVTADNVADHRAHARNYAEIALPFAMCALRNEDIKEVYGG